MGYVEHGEGPSLLPSYATYASSVMLSQSPSVNLSLCLIQQSWLIFSPLHSVTASCIAASCERTRVYSYASSSCLEKKSICMCIGKWYLVSPFHRLPGIEMLRVVQTFGEDALLLDCTVL